MWVSVILGFDQDGQLVHLWREAFQRHGELVGELTCEIEYVKDLRRHTMIARLRKDGADVLPPLTDAVVRVVRGKSINASGIVSDGMVGKWRAQAWRMEIVSLEQPDIGITAQTATVKKAMMHQPS